MDFAVIEANAIAMERAISEKVELLTLVWMAELEEGSNACQRLEHAASG